MSTHLYTLYTLCTLCAEGRSKLKLALQCNMTAPVGPAKRAMAVTFRCLSISDASRQAQKNAPICELTLLLLDGVPESLWNVAHKLARSIAVWPMGPSKTQRGYLLSQGRMLAPAYSKPAKLDRGMDMSKLIQRVLTEMLSQFT
jgi:hypothetical protein